ncbi:MAG: PH domain-containing protein [Bacteroidetes bacterium]|nr:PH domain-containing protein [Bacteroidota bacterium]
MIPDQQRTAPAPITVTFNQLIRPYLVLRIGFAMAITVIGLPLAVIWFCGVGQWWARHYFQKLQCTLDDHAVRFRKGIIVEVEKTIPLENIQDVTFIEGPILRRFDLAMLRFETAGYSERQSHAMSLVGIINAHTFRDQILAARDALRRQGHPTTSTSTTSLAGIERQLDEIITLLREQRRS